MFIQTMTNEEKIREYRADLPELTANNERIDNSEYVAKQLKKSSKNGKLKFVRQYTTSRNNKYLNVFVYTKDNGSHRKNTKWNWEVFSVALMSTYKGTCAITFYEDASIAVSFQPHFFYRYKERFMKVCDWNTRAQLQNAKTVEDIIAIYIKRNTTLTWCQTNSKFGDMAHVFAPVNDGVALIQFDGSQPKANTFITEGMYSDKQNDMIEYVKLHEELKEESGKLIAQLNEILGNDEFNNNNLITSKLCEKKI